MSFEHISIFVNHAMEIVQKSMEFKQLLNKGMHYKELLISFSNQFSPVRTFKSATHITIYYCNLSYKISFVSIVLHQPLCMYSKLCYFQLFAKP